MDFQAGQTLLFDKPIGWSSFQLVKKVRNIITRYSGTKIKVGHAGTLDPLATGLLVICTGKHTKIIESLQVGQKGYELIFKLGATTPSFDSEFSEENITDASHINEADINAALPGFRGYIKQFPPIFSAVKIDGKRAYKAARKGKEIKLRPRMVQIDKFEITDFQTPQHVKAVIHCGKGTYIRSLVNDLGQNLGVGAYILELRRTFVGPSKIEDAWTIENFEKWLMVNC